MDKEHHPHHRLYQLIADIEDADTCAKFFEDLCTPKELRSLEQRLDVAVYLKQGYAYLEILEMTGASSATISRVRHCMLGDGNGGVMDKILNKVQFPREEAPETPETP